MVGNVFEAEPKKKLKIKVLQRTGTDVQDREEDWNWRPKFPSMSGHLGFTFFPSKWLGVSIPDMEIEFSAAHQLTSGRGSGDENVSFQKTGIWRLPGIIRKKAGSWKPEISSLMMKRGQSTRAETEKFTSPLGQRAYWGKFPSSYNVKKCPGCTSTNSLFLTWFSSWKIAACLNWNYQGSSHPSCLWNFNIYIYAFILWLRLFRSPHIK